MEKYRLDECCEILDSQRIPITGADRVAGEYPYYGANGVQDYVADYIFDDELVLLAEDGGNFGSKTRPIAYRVSGKCWVNNHAHVLKPKDMLDVDFLCYSLMFYNVDGMVNGATRQKLTQAAMRQMLIPKMELMEQQKIVKKLKAVQNVMDARRQQLAELDNLVKARFVEVFGDETSMRMWPCCKVGDVADVSVGVVIKPAQYYTDDNTIGIPAFRSLNIGEMYVKNNNWVYFTPEGNEKNSKSILQENDLVIVRSGAPGTACVVPKEYSGYNAIDIIIARPDDNKIDPVFMCAFTNFPHGKKQIEAGTGGAAQQHFNVGKYKGMTLILPPMEMQKQFAAFVAQVDKSKAVVQKALDEAQMLFDGLMQQYFG